jgi:hypothetical protein
MTTTGVGRDFLTIRAALRGGDPRPGRFDVIIPGTLVVMKNTGRCSGLLRKAVFVVVGLTHARRVAGMIP